MRLVKHVVEIPGSSPIMGLKGVKELGIFSDRKEWKETRAILGGY